MAREAPDDLVSKCVFLAPHMWLWAHPLLTFTPVVSGLPCGLTCRGPLLTGSRVLGLGQGQHVSQANGWEGRERVKNTGS